MFKPEPLQERAAEELKRTAQEVGSLKPEEIKVLIIVGLMIVFWIASTWVSFLNTNIVACAGLIVMFLPGIRVLNERDLLSAIPIDIIMFLGCTMAFMSGFMQTDATSWIMNMIFAGSDQWPYLLVLSMIAAIPIIAHVLIQSGPVIVTLCIPPLVALAVSCGINPLIVAFVAAVGGGVQFMLPIDGIYLMTFGYRYYSVKDLLKFGWLPTLALFIVCITLVPLMVQVSMLL